MSRPDEEIEIQAFTIERTTIKTPRGVFDMARERDRLDNEYDVELSDMDGETLIIAPDGKVINPYGLADDVDLIKVLEPILREIPTWRVEQYAAGRRAEEE